ncbi:MAG: TetR/AcrR family transcriptional regulator [Clostridia bacterium]|nr:TetR/AcrR family transcriptional regulator [Clostridia bacterium]MBQ3554018.1 TetR/AcrR family transcriptional regulator [Clostridia bacterium]
MDRRQRKTREAIFRAFTELLSQKPENRITVGEIIASADVGRATFYAHFPTKDFLLKELCEELFCHIFDSAEGVPHQHIFHCDAPDSVFLHLLYHLKNNDNQILTLLTSQNSELFAKYFKSEFIHLVERWVLSRKREKEWRVPKEFLVHHITSSFVAAVQWWSEQKMKQSPEEIYAYFLNVLGIEEGSR